MTMLVGDHLQGCFLHSRLSWNLPAVPGIFMGRRPTFDGTSCQAHKLLMSFSIIIYFFIFLLGHKDVAELLLENVANRDCRTKTGITPLFQVTGEGFSRQNLLYVVYEKFKGLTFKTLLSMA